MRVPGAIGRVGSALGAGTQGRLSFQIHGNPVLSEILEMYVFLVFESQERFVPQPRSSGCITGSVNSTSSYLQLVGRAAVWIQHRQDGPHGLVHDRDGNDFYFGMNE